MKILFCFFTVITVLVFTTLIIGYFLPIKHEATVGKTIDCEIEKLFEKIVNVEKIPEWRNEVKTIKLLSRTENQINYIEFQNDESIEYEMLVDKKDYRIENIIKSKNLPYGGKWVMTFTRISNSKTEIKITEFGEVYNIFFRFVSAFVIGHNRTLKNYIERLL